METTSTTHPAKVQTIIDLFTAWETVTVYRSDDGKFYSVEATNHTGGNGLNAVHMQVHVSYHMSTVGRIAKARYAPLLGEATEMTGINDIRTWAHIGGI